MMLHLGGPESPEQLRARQARYVALESGCYRVDLDGEGVGWVGVWDHSDDAAEVGWSVVPAAQGRGVATEATRLLLDYARALGRWRWAHAYPSVGNGPSNALCRRLGFELLGAHDGEYPPGSGNILRCNDWRIGVG
jgi:RimJ/RimL family protein N-acetyltransferase